MRLNFAIFFVLSYFITSCTKKSKVKETAVITASNSISTNSQTDSLTKKPLVNQPLPKSDTIIIHKEKFIHNANNIDCSFTREYPRVEYKRDTTIEKRINKTILDAFSITKFRKTPKNMLCEGEEAITDFKAYNYQKKILSIILENNFLGEGAGHGYNKTSVLNLDLKTGEKIISESIFKKEQLPSLKQKLLALAKPQVDSLIGEYPMETIESHLNDLIYSITDKGITFYAVTGNGQVQELQLFMPFAELKSYLKKGTYFTKI